MLKRIAIGALGAVVSLVAARPVLADTYTITSDSIPYNVLTTINDTSTPVTNEGGYAGGIVINLTDTTTSATSSFTVWCDDIAQNLSVPGSYALTTMSSEIGTNTNIYGGALDATRVNQINALLYAVADGQINVATAATAAAVQAAIWTLEYQAATNDTGYNVASGNFFISSYNGDNISAVVTDANQYLSYVSNGTWLPNSSDTVEQLTSTGSGQSLVYLGVTATGKPVNLPEPGSLALLATGLAGVAGLRRKRAR